MKCALLYFMAGLSGLHGNFLQSLPELNRLVQVVSSAIALAKADNPCPDKVIIR